MNFEEQLHTYFEGRENKIPQVSYKPMLKYFWDASAYLKQERIDRLEKENAELKEVVSKSNEENLLLRKIAYAYKNLDCMSSKEAVESITIKGWGRQLDYENWCINNEKNVLNLDWKTLE